MLRLHFECNNEDVDLELSDYAICSCRDFVDDVVLNHTSETGNRFHLPLLSMNGERILRNSPRNFLDLISDGDTILVKCSQIEAVETTLFTGPFILGQLILGMHVSNSSSGEDELDLEDVKITIAGTEFDKIGSEITGFQNGETNCAICQETMKNDEKLKKLPCGDVFHVLCIRNWLTKQSYRCPLCRRAVLNRDIVPHEPS